MRVGLERTIPLRTTIVFPQTMDGLDARKRVKKIIVDDEEEEEEEDSNEQNGLGAVAPVAQILETGSMRKAATTTHQNVERSSQSSESESDSESSGDSEHSSSDEEQSESDFEKEKQQRPATRRIGARHQDDDFSMSAGEVKINRTEKERIPFFIF